MARITVEDCLDQIPNRFLLAATSVKRAKMLLRGARPLVDSDNKEVVTSLREIADGQVSPIGVVLPGPHDMKALPEPTE
jgi:DNA-directed RNA polymerase subunit omega